MGFLIHFNFNSTPFLKLNAVIIWLTILYNLTIMFDGLTSCNLWGFVKNCGTGSSFSIVECATFDYWLLLTAANRGVLSRWCPTEKVLFVIDLFTWVCPINQYSWHDCFVAIISVACYKLHFILYLSKTFSHGFVDCELVSRG